MCSIAEQKARQAATDSRCFTCFRPKRRPGWYCAACNKAVERLLAKLNRRAASRKE